MTTHYRAGPTDQPWEAEHVGNEIDTTVMRRGFDSRIGHIRDPIEVHYSVIGQRAAEHLTHELNELDRLRRVEALALAWHNAILATNGVYDAEQALRAALQPQEPPQ